MHARVLLSFALVVITCRCSPTTVDDRGPDDDSGSTGGSTSVPTGGGNPGVAPPITCEPCEAGCELQHDWSSTHGGGSITNANGVALGESGEVFFAGITSAPISFDGATLDNPGSNSAFVLSVDGAGAPRWGTIFGGAGAQGAGAIAASDTRVAVAGFSLEPIDFGGGPLGAGGFVAIFDANGGQHVASTTLSGATEASNGTDILFDDDAGVIVAQRFGDHSIAVTQLDAALRETWSEVVFTDTVVPAARIAATPGGGFLLAFQFERPSVGFAGVVLEGPGLAILSVDVDKSVRWHRVIRGLDTSSPPFLGDIAVDAQGEVWLSCLSGGPTDFGAGPVGDTIDSIYAAGFVARYTSDGALRWTRFLPSENAWMKGLTVDSQQRVTVLTSAKAIDFGGGQVAEEHLFLESLVLGRLDGCGDHLWSRAIGTSVSNFSTARLTSDEADGVVVAGAFTQFLDLGSAQHTAPDGDETLFVARMAPGR